MSRPTVWEWIRGYVIIVVTGRAVGAFLSRSVEHGIDMADVRFVGPSSITARIGLDGFRRLMSVAHGAGCRIQVSRRGGAPFMVRSIFTRKAALVGALGFFVVLSLLASLVWKVDIRGATEAHKAEIRRVLGASGIKPGVSRSLVDCDHIRKALFAQIVELAWVGAELRGVVLIITVAEKELPDVPSGPVDLVAACDAVVSRLIVLEGVAEVREGDTVARGDLLVSAASGGSRPGRARAIVQGRIWRSFGARVPLVVETRFRTGRAIRQLIVTIGGKRVVFGRSLSFAAFDLSVRRLPAPRGMREGSAVEVELATAYELVIERVELGSSTAREMAVASARAAAMEYLASGKKAVEVVERTTETSDAITAEVVVETVEDIGMAQERRSSAPVRSGGTNSL